MIKVSDRLAHK